MDETDDHQPPLTLHHLSFTKGELEGRPCIVIYNSATDKTDVIAFKSKGYPEALIAMATLEMFGVPLPKSALAAKTVLHKPRAAKLILPGSNASN